MKLASLEELPSFALLGPGFGNGQFLLLRDLREAAQGDPKLVYARYETPGSRPLVYGAGSTISCPVELETELPEVCIELDAEGYARKIDRIREAIASGDVYQVCLTTRARVSRPTGAELLSRMCARGVPRFAAWVRLPDGEELVSASPELFFETEGRSVHTEPMKGTARPGQSGELQASGKDRCELAMITDLLRNDLAQVCVPKTVQVANERRLLHLPYALQTVSDVIGELGTDATPLEVLAALHPGGSVTGAPKTAALSMIRALETSPRGAYCGTLGLWQAERSTFSLLIRTASRVAEGWIYGVGGGVVYDSDPQMEIEELRTKLGAL
jgi:anthranilate/para-aminobenzoate synthase component I